MQVVRILVQITYDENQSTLRYRMSLFDEIEIESGHILR